MLVVMLLPGCAPEATFEERLERAKFHEESDALKSYFHGYWRRIQSSANSALEHCFPLRDFHYTHVTLVADLLPNQHISNIQVRPDDEMTRCFAAKFAESPFPAPPSSLGLKGLPIRAEVALDPASDAP